MAIHIPLRRFFLPFPPASEIFVANRNNTAFKSSADGGISFSEFYDAGGSVGAQPIMAQAGDFLYRLAEDGIGRVSRRNTALWTDTIGLDVNQPCGMLATSHEIIAYGQSDKICVSPLDNGLQFTVRSLPVANVAQMVQRGSTIVGIRQVTNQVIVSHDKGQTWIAYGTNGGTAPILLSCIAVTPTNFVIGGQDASGGLIIYSPTGDAGSWTAQNVGLSNIGRMAYNSNIGRLIALATTPATFISDNDGVTWAAGASPPTTFTGQRPIGYSFYSTLAQACFFSPALAAVPGRIYRTVNGTAWSTPVSDGSNLVTTITELIAT